MAPLPPRDMRSAKEYGMMTWGIWLIVVSVISAIIAIVLVLNVQTPTRFMSVRDIEVEQSKLLLGYICAALSSTLFLVGVIMAVVGKARDTVLEEMKRRSTD